MPVPMDDRDERDDWEPEQDEEAHEDWERDPWWECLEDPKWREGL
jgi:hypothetical protein